MKNKFLLLFIIIMSLFIIACKDKGNDDNTNKDNNNTSENQNGDNQTGENQTGDTDPASGSIAKIHFVFSQVTQIDIQTKKDDGSVTYTLISEDKIQYFTSSFQNIGFVGAKDVDTTKEAKYIISIDDANAENRIIEIYDSYILFEGHYYSCESGLEFIDNYNSNNVDKTSSDSGWLPFI